MQINKFIYKYRANGNELNCNTFYFVWICLGILETRARLQNNRLNYLATATGIQLKNKTDRSCDSTLECVEVFKTY